MLVAVVVLAATTFAFPQTRNQTKPKIAQTKLLEIVKLVNDKQFVEAETRLKQILQKSPRDFNARTLLGIVYTETNQLDLAEQEYRTALQINPKFITALVNLGILLAQTGKAEEAVGKLEQVLKLQPDHSGAIYNLSGLYAARGELKKALPLLEKLAGITKTNKTPKSTDLALLFALAKSYATLKMSNELGKTISYIEKLGDGDIRVFFTLGLNLAQVGEYEGAARLFEKVNLARPNSYEVLYNLGVAYYNLNQLDSARAALLQVIALNQNAPEAFYRLGLIASEKKEVENALRFWLKALELKPEYAEVNFLIGEELRKQKKYIAALPFYEKAGAQNVENPLYQLRLGVSYFRLKQYAQAGEIFERMLVKYPDDFNFNYLHGYTARNQGLYDKALAAFEKADRISPNNADVIAGLAFIAFQRGEIEKAEQLLRRTLQLDAKNFSAHYDLGRLLVSQHRYAEALPILERSVDINKNDPSTRYQLFLVYSRLKQKEKANQSLAEFKRLEAEFKRVSDSPITDENQNLPENLENSKP